VISAFEYFGPAASLVQALKYGNQPYLAKDAAAFLAYQYLRLDLPIPDLIVPVPISFTRYLMRGYNQSFLLAQEMGKLLNRPATNLFKRYSGDLPQASLNRAQREALAQSSFCWKKRMDIKEKVVLLIDDVRTTGTTLQHLGNLLREGYPAALYGMTLCS
jgi:ComF family protein